MGRHVVAKALAVLVLVLVLTNSSYADPIGKGPDMRPPSFGLHPKGGFANEAMDAANWKCGTRIIDGVTSNCVVIEFPVVPNPPHSDVTGCDWFLPTFCDDSVADSLHLPPTNAALHAFPPGYLLIPGVAAFKVHTEPLSWTAARSACEAEGAHLAVPSTAADYSALFAVLDFIIPAHNGAYIGLSDTAEENSFVAVTGQPLCMMAHEEWAASEPNNGLVAGVQGPVENCVKFGDKNLPSMSDVPCSDSLPFVCQISLPSRVTKCRGKP